MGLYKKAFSAGDDHAFFLDQKVLSFSPVAPSVLAIFSKLHEFLQNSISSRMSGGFNIFALRTTFKRFSAKCTSLSKTAFSALDQHVLSFLHCVHHFLTLFAKCTRFLKSKTALLGRDQNVLSFWHSAHHLLAIFMKVHEFVQTAFSALDQHVLSFSLWAHHLLAFSAKCMTFYKTAFSARDQHALTFSR